MANWRDHVSPEPPWEDAQEVEQEMEEGRRPIFRELATEVWVAMLNKTGKKPTEMNWEVFEHLVNMGWAPASVVRKNTEMIWGWMDEVTVAAERVATAHKVGERLDSSIKGLKKLLKKDPCWIGKLSNKLDSLPGDAPDPPEIYERETTKGHLITRSVKEDDGIIVCRRCGRTSRATRWFNNERNPCPRFNCEPSDLIPIGTEPL